MSSPNQIRVNFINPYYMNVYVIIWSIKSQNSIFLSYLQNGSFQDYKPLRELWDIRIMFEVITNLLFFFFIKSVKSPKIEPLD